MNLRSCLIMSVACLCLLALAPTTAEGQTEIPISGTPPSGEASGTISAPGEVGSYYFDVPGDAGGLWTMWTAVGVDSLLLFSYSMTGPPDDSNDNCEVPGCDLDHTATHSRLDKDLTGGVRCYLRVQGSGTATGDYTVKVRHIIPDLEVNRNLVSLGAISEPAIDTSVYIYNASIGSFDWTVSESVSWLTVDPMSGTTSTEQDTLTVTVDPTGLTLDQSYSDAFTVSRDGAPGDSETVTVTFIYSDVPEIPLTGDPLSGELSGTIPGAGDEVWYQLYVPPGEGGTWNMWTAVGVDTILRLHATYGGIPTAANDNCEVPGCDLDHTAQHSRIDHDLTADTRYYLAVRGSGTATGSFTVKVRKAPILPPNNPPELTNGDVAPDSGDDATTFIYTVDYYDEDGDAPQAKQLYIDGTAYAMSLQTGTADNGTYQYQTTGVELGIGDHEYYFSFTDGHGGSDRLPDSGPLSGPAVTVEFVDVAADHWAYDEIMACAYAGVAGGYEDGTYHPDWLVSRDMMAVYIARAKAGGEEGVPDGPAEATFNDVPTDHWAFDHVEFCVAEGVVTGYDEVTYFPQLIVTRAQMATFIARAHAGGDEGVGSGPVVPTFNDVPAQHWAYKYVEYCCAQDIVQGYDDVTYFPDFNVSRGQMAVFISRAFYLMP